MIASVACTEYCGLFLLRLISCHRVCVGWARSAVQRPISHCNSCGRSIAARRMQLCEGSASPRVTTCCDRRLRPGSTFPQSTQFHCLKSKVLGEWGPGLQWTVLGCLSQWSNPQFRFPKLSDFFLSAASLPIVAGGVLADILSFCLAAG